MRLENERYCQNCGEAIDKNLNVCPKCGAQQNEVFTESISQKTTNSEGVRWLISLLLCWFLGAIGAHRFFVGKIGTGILMIITCGGLGIWWLIDFIMILVGEFSDNQGIK